MTKEMKQILITVMAGAGASIIGALVTDYLRDKKEQKKKNQLIQKP